MASSVRAPKGLEFVLHDADSNSKRPFDESEYVKSRLADPKFDPKMYPDPLRRRPTAQQLLPGVTAEDEKRWLAMIAASKQAKQTN